MQWNKIVMNYQIKCNKYQMNKLLVQVMKVASLKNLSQIFNLKNLKF